MPPSLTKLRDLPLEMLELVLMRTYLMLCSRDPEPYHCRLDRPMSGESSRSQSDDDDHGDHIECTNRCLECRAFTLVASVCSSWHLTLIGWPQSPTRHWLRHKLKKLIECSCLPFSRSAVTLDMFSCSQPGDSAKYHAEYMTRLHDIVYILHGCDSCEILKFSATTHQILESVIDVDGLSYARDIVACEQTSQLYVIGFVARFQPDMFIWRGRSSAASILRWLPRSPSDTFQAESLSVTSTRLLVTAPCTRQLIQFDAVGNELRRVQLPGHMKPEHAVESPTGTFIVGCKNKQLSTHQVIEVDCSGDTLRQFNRSLSHYWPKRLAADSHGNIFVPGRSCILLLDAHLTLRSVIVDKRQLDNKSPQRLCYMEQLGQLVVLLEYYVGSNFMNDIRNDIATFDVLHRQRRLSP